MDVPPDVLAQLQTDFPASEVEQRVRQLEKLICGERVQRCIVFAARGHGWYFDQLCRLSRGDYRDAIMAAEYGGGVRLYDFNQPIPSAKFVDPPF